MKEEQVQELLYQSLETEIGGISVYETALQCADNPELKQEWQKYLEETQRHEEILREVFSQLDLDPEQDTPGREIVRSKGRSLVQAMERALETMEKASAQLVAAECVVEAETKDHSNWELIGMVAQKSNGKKAKVLKDAYDEVEEEEDRHLYHTMGWTRELWMESLGLPAVLPPPEEEKDVTTAIGAARAEQQRDDSL